MAVLLSGSHASQPTDLEALIVAAPPHGKAQLSFKPYTLGACRHCAHNSRGADELRFETTQQVNQIVVSLSMTSKTGGGGGFSWSYVPFADIVASEKTLDSMPQVRSLTVLGGGEGGLGCLCLCACMCVRGA